MAASSFLCKKAFLGMTAISAFMTVNGCSTLFDAPSVEGMKQQVSAKVMSDLAAIAAEEALAMMPVDMSLLGSAEQTISSPNEMVADMAGGLASNAASSGISMAKNSVGALSGDALAAGAAISSGTAGYAALHPGERRMPTLSFDKVDADMPQLMMQGMGNATVLLNGEKIESESVTKGGRIMLIRPGRHGLRVEYPSDPPFSADFYIEKGERLTLRGN